MESIPGTLLHDEQKITFIGVVLVWRLFGRVGTLEPYVLERSAHSIPSGWIVFFFLEGFFFPALFSLSRHEFRSTISACLTRLLQP